MRDTTIKSIDALINSATDDSQEVKDTVISSLRAMAGKDTVPVVQQLERWLTNCKPGSTPVNQRYIIIKSIKEIVTTHCQQSGALSDPVLKSLLTVSVAEMTHGNLDINSEWTLEACALTVELIDLAPHIGCPMLIDPITSTALPHYFYMHTLAVYAQLSPLRFLPHLKEALSKILPILGLVKQDNQRQVFASSLAAWADAVLQVDQHKRDMADGKTPSSGSDGTYTPRSTKAEGIKFGDYSDEFYSAIQFFVGDWSRISEQKVRGPVLHAIGSMFACLNDENRIAQMPKVVDLLIAGLKKEKPSQQVVVSKGFAAHLSHVSDDVRLEFQKHLEKVFPSLLSNLVATLGAESIVSIAAAESGKEDPIAKIVQNNTRALLQAAENLGEYQMDALVTFLSKTLDAKSGAKEPTTRAACLVMVKHLCSRKKLDCKVDPYLDPIIATVKLTLEDSDWRVKKAIVNTVIAMGASELDFFKAVGGTDLITYAIRHAALPDAVVDEFTEAAAKKKDLANLGTSPQDLRDTCQNAFALFTASQSKLDDVLWPFLLEHIGLYAAEPTLQNALPTICRALVQLGRRKENCDDYYIDFRVQVNVPPPEQLTASFLIHVMCKGYYSDEDLGAILSAMEIVAPLLDDPYQFPDMEEPPIATVWLSMVPSLQEVLQKGTVSMSDWEDMVCKLITKTLTARQQEKWAQDVTQAAVNLVPAVERPIYIPQSRALLILTGIGISKCTKRDFVSSTTDAIIEQSDHTLEMHRQGLAKALGYVASAHPDVAMERLTMLSKVVEKKSFFGGKDKGKKGPLEISRAIAGTGFCYAVKRMSGTILGSRLDSAIWPVLSTVLSDPKENPGIVREEVLLALPIMEAPMKKLQAYNFKARDAFVELLMGLVAGGLTAPSKDKPTPASVGGLLKMVTNVANAISALIRAVPNPPLDPAVINKLVSSLAVPFAKKDWSLCEKEELLQAGETSMVNLMSALVNNTQYIVLDELWNPLQDMAESSKDTERGKALAILQSTIDAAAKRIIKESQAEEGASQKHAEGSTLGMIAARMVPRVLDNVPEVRTAAVDIISSVAKLFGLFHPKNVQEAATDLDAIVSELEGVRERVEILVRDGTQGAEREAAQITKVLCAQVVTLFPQRDHFTEVIGALLAKGILDPQEGAASCSCIVLHGMIRGLGGVLTEADAKRYIGVMVSCVPKVESREQVKNGLLLSVRNLTKHHTLPSFSALLNLSEPPYSAEVVAALEAVGNDATLAKTFLLHCVDSMLNSQLVEDRPDAKDKRKSVKDVAVVPMAACAAIGAVTLAAKGAEVALEMRCALAGTLMLYLSVTHDLGKKERISVVVNSLRQLVENTATEVTMNRMERYNGWALLEDRDYFLVACCECLKYISAEDNEDEGNNDKHLECTAESGLDLPPGEPTQFVHDMATFMLPYVNKPSACHRRVGINVSSFLLRNCMTDITLIEGVVTALLSRCGTDEGEMLRSEALASLNQLKVHRYQDVKDHIAPVLSALLSNFNDPNESVVLSAMITLHDLIEGLSDKTQVAPTCVNIINKVKTLFEFPGTRVRANTYEILALLFQLALDGHLNNSMMEQQVHLHLPTMIAHVEDPEVDVRHSTKKCMVNAMLFMAKLQGMNGNMDAKNKLEEVYKKPHMQPGSKTKPDEFANDFCFIWVLYYPGHVTDLLVGLMTFFDQPHAESIRLQAVTFCGFMLKHLPPKELGRAHVDSLIANITRKLNPNTEKSAAVRAKAARGLGMLREL